MANIKSILQRLRDRARQEDISFQLVLQLFCQEEFLRRLSHSQYKDQLILKGGLFLYLISNFDSRPTMDIDFLMKSQINDIEKTGQMIEKIIKTDTGNDFIRFKINAIEPISEQKEHPGIRVKILGLLDNTRTPFDIDIGIGDLVVPRPNKIKIEPLLKEFTSSKILTYSLESTIAEKWDAIIDRMELTSRMKDFFDIYYLALNYSFEGLKLQKAIFETVTNRKRVFGKDTLRQVALIGEDKDFMIRWESFTKNTLKIQLSFMDVIELILKFLGQPFEKILKEEEFFLKWKKEEKLWE